MKRISLLMLIILAAPALATSAGPGISPDEALRILKEGNARYVDGKLQHPRQGPERRALTSGQGQHPLAAVLTCSDSRVPPETSTRASAIFSWSGWPATSRPPMK